MNTSFAASAPSAPPPRMRPTMPPAGSTRSWRRVTPHCCATRGISLPPRQCLADDPVELLAAGKSVGDPAILDYPQRPGDDRALLKAAGNELAAADRQARRLPRRDRCRVRAAAREQQAVDGAIA